MKYIVLLTFFCYSLSPAFSQDKKLAFERIVGPRAVSSQFGFLAGAWLPAGNLSLLGVHPSLGLQGGIRYFRHQLDVTLSVRFLKSANAYDVYRAPYIYTVDNYLGGYIGLDYKYYFMADRSREVGLVAGIGFDGFDINKTDEEYLKPYGINSFNFNLGFRLNWYTSGRTYFALQPRYNFIHYNNHGGTNLDGGAFSVDLFIGGWSHPSNNSNQ